MNGKNRKIGYAVKRLLCCSLLVCLLCLFYDGSAARVQAASGWKMPEAFEQITGEGKYIQDQYFYYLDMEKVGLLDQFLAVFNSIANMLFSLEVMIARAAIYLFYHCMTFDGSMFSEQIQIIQGLLRESMFLPFFEVALALLGIKLIAKLFRRNFAGIFSECAYMIIIFVAASFVARYSNEALDVATDKAKQISIQSMVSMNSATEVKGGTTEEYAAIAAGLLWKNIVHDPWRQLEFGDAGNTETLEEKLMRERDSKKRQEIIEGKAESIPTLSGSNVHDRLSLVLFYFVPITIKGGIYTVLAVAQLFFQIMAVFFVLLAPLILVVSLFPGYGTLIIETWLRKLMEFEIGIIITTLLIAFMVYLDNAMLKLSGQYGIVMSFLLQTVIALSLFFGRNHIFGMFQKLQKAVQSPAYANALMRNSATTDPKKVRQVEQRAAEAVRKAPAKVRAIGGAVRNTWQAYDEKMKDLDTRVQVAANGGTARGLDVETQERAYDLYQSTERRKQEKEKQERAAKEREQKAENRSTAHRVKAVNYWNDKQDAKLVDLHAKRLRTKAAEEAEKKERAVGKGTVVAFRERSPEESNHHADAAERPAAGQGPKDQKVQFSFEQPKEQSETGKSHNTARMSDAAARPGRQSNTGQRTERKISAASLPAPGIQIREHVNGGRRKPRPAAWKQMNIRNQKQKGAADDRTGTGRADMQNSTPGTAGDRRSTGAGRRTAGRERNRI